MCEGVGDVWQRQAIACGNLQALKAYRPKRGATNFFGVENSLGKVFFSSLWLIILKDLESYNF